MYVHFPYFCQKKEKINKKLMTTVAYGDRQDGGRGDRGRIWKTRAETMLVEPPRAVWPSSHWEASGRVPL